MTKLQQVVWKWMVLPQQHPDYNLELHEYLEKKKVKATEKEIAQAVDIVTDMAMRQQSQ